MSGEAVLGKIPVQLIHDPIARDLGQDAGGGNAEADPVTTDQCCMSDGKSLDWQPIHKSMTALMSALMKASQRARHGKMGCPQDVELSDFF